MSNLTQPRQVRVLHCRIYSPGMENRGGTNDSKNILKAGVDIRPFARKIDIYESIFNNTLSGNLTIMEDIGLMEYLPIVGVELLYISFAVDDEDGNTQTFNNTFRVTKVHNITYPRHQYRLYTLEFASIEFVESVSNRISRAFTGRCDEIVKEILTQDLKTAPGRIASIEQTHSQVAVTIPNYTPLQAINYFAILAQTKAKKESNFLFFETLAGFHFTSISKLIEDANKQKKIPTFNADGSIMFQEQLLDDDARNSVARMMQEQTFDLLHDIAAGTLRAQMVHFDILARQLDKPEDSRYTDTFKETTHLDKHPVYPENYDKFINSSARIFTVPSNAWIGGSKYMGAKKETPEQLAMREAIILRNRQLREIRHIQTLLDLPGQPNLRAGSIVNVNYPPTRMLSDAEGTISTARHGKPTPLYSGKHIVAEVHHRITYTLNDAAEYRMSVKVCRDSLGVKLIGWDK